MKKINWLDHIANLLVVILGISIAFYLENYKEEKRGTEQEIKYLESLIKDLETDIEAFDTLISINKRIGEALVSLSNAAATQGRSGYESDSLLAQHMLLIQYNPPISAQRITYESLKSSGNMELIDDFELRNQVVEIYEQYYRGALEYDASIDQNLRDFVKPFYMNNVRFTSGFTVNPNFLSKPEFANMTFAYRFLFLAKDKFYQTTKLEVEDVVGKLKERVNLLRG